MYVFLKSQVKYIYSDTSYSGYLFIPYLEQVNVF